MIKITPENIVNAISETLLVVDSTGKIRWVNKAVNKLLEYEESEITGQHISILIPHEFRLPHEVLFNSFKYQTSSVPMGYARPLSILTRKNIKKPVFIELTPVEFEHERCILATICDSHIAKKNEGNLSDINGLFNQSQAPDSIGAWDWNIRTGELSLSDNVFDILGLDSYKSPVSYKDFFTLVHEDDKTAVSAAIESALSGKSEYFISHRVVRKDASIRHVVERGKVYFSEEGVPERLMGTIQDVTAEYDYQTQVKVADSVFNYSYDGAISTDKNLDVKKVNPSFERMVGYSSAYLEGTPISDLIPELKKTSTTKILNKNGFWSGRVICNGKGNSFPAHLSIVEVSDNMKYGNKIYVITLSDISTLTLHEKQLEKLAYHDALTSLFNRNFFLQKLTSEVKSATQSMCLIFIDLDGFKEVNDSQGHDEGDKVLCEISKLLKECVGEEVLLSRFGGDEFVILYKSGEYNIIENLTKKILQSLSLSLVYGKQKFKITASIGIAIFPDNGKSSQELLKKADIAMYKAKELGRNRFLFYEDKFSNEKDYRRQIVSDLEAAIKDGQISAHFQKIISTKKEAIHRFEILARWCHPDKGFISPAEFIPLAEEHSIISDLGEVILNKACDFLRSWYEIMPEKAVVSVNLSSSQLFEIDIVNAIENASGKEGIILNSLMFEITESSVMKDFNKAQVVLNKIKKLGCYIALDDFGTGYSSLSYLSRLPVDEVKIDKSFVSKLLISQQDRLICEAIISLSHALKLNVVAEGVEEIAQCQQLKRFGCDFLQGFLFARPKSSADILTPQYLDQTAEALMSYEI